MTSDVGEWRCAHGDVAVRLERRPELESAGYPFMFVLRVSRGGESLDVEPLTKGDLLQLRMMMARTCRGAVR